MKTKLIFLVGTIFLFWNCSTKPKKDDVIVLYNKYKVEVLGIKADSVLPFNYFKDYLKYKKEGIANFM